MGGTPWSKYKKPEVVSEGGPWAKYGANFDSPREAVDALPEFLTRTADEKNAQRANANNRAFVEKLPQPKSTTGRVGTAAGQYLNSMTLGNADNLNAGLDTVLGINTMGDSFSARKGRYRDARGELMEANPVSAAVGEIGGYLAPGAAAWKGMSAAGKAIPGVAGLNSAAQSAGRVPAYMSRLLGSAGLFTADAGLYGATVGASNEAALTGQDASLGDRGRVGKDYALANAGEMGEAMGVDVPSFFKPIPVAPLMPFAGSVVERGIKGIGSGGKMITPDRVQAEVLGNVGRAPSPNSTATAMAEVIPAERVTSGTVKTFRFIENALRNGLKDAGLPAAEITDRVTRGFNSIHKSLPALADGRTTLAQLIEREFADAGPQVSENLRLFLLRVGLDDPAVTSGVIQEMRTGQVEDFRSAVNENLGSQRQYDLEQSLKQGLSKIGETYDQILNKAKEQGNNSPLADSMREQLLDSRFKFELTEAASKKGWKDVDKYIQQDPWDAAHKLKSKLLSEARAAKSSGNYEKYQEPAVYLREMLNELPGYENLSRMYAKEASVLDTLGHVDTLPNGQKKTVEGFGPKLRKAGRSETETLRMADEFAAMPTRQQGAAAISTGQVLKDQLRTARPGGTDLQGQDVMGLRLTDLQNEGMMSTNPEIPGALPMVFGEAGENISKRVDDIVNSRKFLADIDPNTGSNTVNKANAQMSGDSVVTSGLPRTMTSGYTQSGLIDATMFASGLPPVATMLTKGIPKLGKMLGPGRGTRAEIAETLMQRPARRGPPPAAPKALPQLTGRNRPRKWRKDPKWSDPNLTNPQIEPPKQSGVPMLSSPTATGAGLGGFAGGAAPAESYEERLRNAAIGAGIGAGVGKLDSRIGFTRGGLPTMKNGAGGRGQLPMDEASRIERGELGYGPYKSSPTSVNDSHGDELFAYKELKSADGHGVAAADINILPREKIVSIRDIVTRPTMRRKGLASQLVEDLRKEYPDYKIEVTNMTDDGSKFFGSRYNIDADGALTGNKLPSAQSDSPVLTAGIGGRRRKDVMKDAARNNLPAVQSKQMPPGGLPIKNQRPVDTGYDLPVPSALRQDLTTAGVVGLGLSIPIAPMLYSMYKAEQYKKGKPAISMREFVQALEEEQRRRNGVPSAPSVKPQLPQVPQTQ